MTSEDECIEALQRAADELGESPTKAQYEELGLTPASGTVMRVMGGWNVAKKAAGLEIFERKRSGGGTVEPKPDWVTLPEDESWEELSGQQRWYRKNRARQKGKKERRSEMLRTWLYRQKRENCACRRWGEDHPACLDYHHRDQSEKRDSISRMVAHGFSREAIRAEMAKCEVLCANCHRKKHIDLPDPQEETSQHS